MFGDNTGDGNRNGDVPAAANPDRVGSHAAALCDNRFLPIITACCPAFPFISGVSFLYFAFSHLSSIACIVGKLIASHLLPVFHCIIRVRAEALFHLRLRNIYPIHLSATFESHSGQLA